MKYIGQKPLSEQSLLHVTQALLTHQVPLHKWGGPIYTFRLGDRLEDRLEDTLGDMSEDRLEDRLEMEDTELVPTSLTTLFLDITHH